MSGGANAFSPFWDVIQRPIDHEELAGRNLQSYSELLVSSNELRNRPHYRALLVYSSRIYHAQQFQWVSESSGRLTA